VISCTLALAGGVIANTELGTGPNETALTASSITGELPVDE
jgi:hypothetical protein